MESLNLGWSQVTDADLVYFKECKKLTSLKIGPSVTDEGLANFEDCDRLEDLTLIGLRGKLITDAGLVHFKDCANLNRLTLHDVNVGDAGLIQI